MSHKAERHMNRNIIEPFIFAVLALGIVGRNNLQCKYTQRRAKKKQVSPIFLQEYIDIFEI